MVSVEKPRMSLCDELVTWSDSNGNPERMQGGKFQKNVSALKSNPEPCAGSN